MVIGSLSIVSSDTGQFFLAIAQKRYWLGLRLRQYRCNEWGCISPSVCLMSICNFFRMYRQQGASYFNTKPSAAFQDSLCFGSYHSNSDNINSFSRYFRCVPMAEDQEEHQIQCISRIKPSLQCSYADSSTTRNWWIAMCYIWSDSARGPRGRVE